MGLLVSDLAQAKKFYGGMLGLQEIERPDFDFPGAWYDLGSGQQLHLMAIKDSPERAQQSPTRDRHIALAVEDYGAALQYLKSRGISYREGSLSRQISFRDPDGNLIELQPIR